MLILNRFTVKAISVHILDVLQHLGYLVNTHLVISHTRVVDNPQNRYAATEDVDTVLWVIRVVANIYVVINQSFGLTQFTLLSAIRNLLADRLKWIVDFHLVQN